MTKQDYKNLGNECFKHLEKINPNGGIREFVRIAVEFGYKEAEKKLTVIQCCETLPTKSDVISELETELLKYNKGKRVGNIDIDLGFRIGFLKAKGIKLNC